VTPAGDGAAEKRLQIVDIEAPGPQNGGSALTPAATRLFTALDEGLLVIDGDGMVIEANSVAAAMLGPDARPLAGRPSPFTGVTVLRANGLPWHGFRLPDSIIHLSNGRGGPEPRRLVVGLARQAGTVRQTGPVRWLSLAIAPLEAFGRTGDLSGPWWVISVVDTPAPGQLPVDGASGLARVPAPGIQPNGAAAGSHRNGSAVAGQPNGSAPAIRMDGVPDGRGWPGLLEFELAFDLAPIGMALVEVDETGRGRLTRLNNVLRSRAGVAWASVDDVDMREIINREDLAVHKARYLQLCAGTVSDTSYRIRFRRPDGLERLGWVQATAHRALAPDPDGPPGRVTHVIYHVIDITERQETQRQLERLALTDALTGLANRLRFEQQTAAALERAGTSRGTVGVMLLDLDRFKVVNDAFGHTAGDALLIDAGARLRAALPAGAIVARLGGDEFAVTIEGLSGCTELLDLAFVVLDALTGHYYLPTGDDVVCTASIGLTTGSANCRDVGDLLREADLALYEAKDRGRNQCAIFDAQLRARANARIQQEHRLRACLDTDGVRMYLQEVRDLRTGAVTGYEALARLDHPTLGTLRPTDFIDVAEDTGLITEVDACIAEQAVAHLGKLAAQADGGRVGEPEPAIAVNVSPRSLASPGYVGRVTEALRRHKVRGDRLLIEVTERTLLDESGASAAGLARLKRLGVRVGIDDFGTGYSALAYLGRFDLDFLKVDRSFVARLGHDERATAVVAAVIALAHAHDLVVTAEGVETAAQAIALEAMGCDRGQGWQFGHPAPPP
jgi:diguanylate cyclase (GGDEF)-like protein/PAS domain S-box-containing protein